MGKCLHYHELVDLSFTRELTKDEQAEYDTLCEIIDAEDAVEYQLIIDRLEKEVADAAGSNAAN